METAIDDQTLAYRTTQGDRTAFQLLLERHYDLIFRVAYRLCGCREMAQDVTQEICLALPTKLKSFKGEASVTTWLYRVVMNRVKDEHRKLTTQDRKLSEYSEIEELRREDRKDSERQADQLNEMLEKLSDDLKETAILVVGEGLSQQEASTILGVKEGTIAWRMSELKKALRKLAKEAA